MGKKVALVAFQGEAMCFVHVLLNAMDMKERGYDVKVIIEGAAVKLVKELNEEGAMFGDMYKKCRDEGMFDCVCKACASKMGSLESAQEQNFNIEGEMFGHPSIGRYMEEGYEIITF